MALKCCISPVLASGFLYVYSQIKPSKGECDRTLLPSEMQYAHTVMVQGGGVRARKSSLLCV